MNRVCLLLTLFAVLALGGCGGVGSNYLDGSLSASYDLTFDEVRVRLYDSELSVEYVVAADQGEMIALRVTVEVDGDAALAEGGVYDLLERGTVGRGEGFGSALPELESGELQLNRYGSADGDEIKGDFSATFVAADESRLNVHGAFLSQLEVVAF